MRPLCACGCGERVPERRKPSAIYATDACKVRACKARRTVVDPIPVTDREKRFPGLKPSARRVAQALAAAGGRGATTAELAQAGVGGFSHTKRLSELRDAGYGIRTERLRNGQSRYWLVSLPGHPTLDTEAAA
jgi:hypothetical protein